MYSRNDDDRRRPVPGSGDEAPCADPAPPDTAILWQRFSVAFDYPVLFTHDVFHPANPALLDVLRRRESGRRHRLAVAMDGGVAAAWPDLPRRIAAFAEAHGEHLELAADPLGLPGGEACKNDPAVLQRLQTWLHQARIDRQSFLLAVGGGALLDVAGFAAATTHRGVRLLRLPTTVLAQNDSAVGVKNGVNAFGMKNFLGSFVPPFGVIADFDFLATLEPRDSRAGLAEAVKVAAIRDGTFWLWLEENAQALAEFRPAATETMIRRCAALHLAHIGQSGDPFEFGSARPLDFGHWAAHKLESLSHHALRHGEAVAIGMALDALYSAEMGLLPTGEAERLCALLERLGFRLWDASLEHRDRDGRALVMQGLAEFREHLGGELSLTLLAGFGQGVDVDAVDLQAMERALDSLKARAAR